MIIISKVHAKKTKNSAHSSTQMILLLLLFVPGVRIKSTACLFVGCPSRPHAFCADDAADGHDALAAVICLFGPALDA